MNPIALYEMKNGNLEALRGMVTVYARIRNIESPDNRRNPVYDMAKKAFLRQPATFAPKTALRTFCRKSLAFLWMNLRTPTT